MWWMRRSWRTDIFTEGADGWSPTCLMNGPRKTTVEFIEICSPSPRERTGKDLNFMQEIAEDLVGREGPEPARRYLTKMEYANYYDYNPKYVHALCLDGRLEGATKDARGWWIIPVDAERIPPSDAHRALWRHYWHKYDKSGAQAARRREARKGKEAIGE